TKKTSNWYKNLQNTLSSSFIQTIFPSLKLNTINSFINTLDLLLYLNNNNYWQLYQYNNNLYISSNNLLTSLTNIIVLSIDIYRTGQ
ncbi:17232_t:CDS:1, partial [Gigaspora rosea]